MVATCVCGPRDGRNMYIPVTGISVSSNIQSLQQWLRWKKLTLHFCPGVLNACFCVWIPVWMHLLVPRKMCSSDPYCIRNNAAMSRRAACLHTH